MITPTGMPWRSERGNSGARGSPGLLCGSIDPLGHRALASQRKASCALTRRCWVSSSLALEQANERKITAAAKAQAFSRDPQGHHEDEQWEKQVRNFRINLLVVFRALRRKILHRGCCHAAASTSGTARLTFHTRSNQEPDLRPWKGP